MGRLKVQPFKKTGADGICSPEQSLRADSLFTIFAGIAEAVEKEVNRRLVLRTFRPGHTDQADKRQDPGQRQKAVEDTGTQHRMGQIPGPEQRGGRKIRRNLCRFLRIFSC